MIVTSCLTTFTRYSQLAVTALFAGEIYITIQDACPHGFRADEHRRGLSRQSA